MAISMTGYGRGEAGPEHCLVTTEIRAVNHRFLDPSFRLPFRYQRFEPELRALVQSMVGRGHLEVTIAIQEVGPTAQSLSINDTLAEAYREAARTLTQGAASEAEIGLWALQQRGVMELTTVTIDEEIIHDAMLTSTEIALTQLNLMREEEGIRITEDLMDRLRQLDSLRTAIAEIAAVEPLSLAERLELRLADLMEQRGRSVELDPARLAQEAAILADKADVAEEIMRLGSHLQQLRDLLLSDTSEGRRMDFLLQEVNREINTIASKSRNVEIDTLTIEMKALTEQVREQTQNLE